MHLLEFYLYLKTKSIESVIQHVFDIFDQVGIQVFPGDAFEYNTINWLGFVLADTMMFHLKFYYLLKGQH